MLKFSFSNSKLLALARYLKSVMGWDVLIKSVGAFDLVAGYTCAKAGICKTFFNPKSRKLVKRGEVTCYAAKMEAVSPSAMRLHWHNWNALLACGQNVSEMVALIEASLPKWMKIIRIHSSGEFYSYEYFQAWLQIARNHPEIIFFGYTKHLDYVLETIEHNLDNFHLNYSYGSTDDVRGTLINTPNGVRFEYNGDIIPTCFIEQSDGQYPNTIKVCASEGTEHEDFFAIRNRETYTIGEH